jgi:hypothetical protein
MKIYSDSEELQSHLNTRNLLILSFGMVILVFLLQGNVGFNIPDEGFLWYGTIRTALGEVPIRDFQSYEPGRYYWSLFWVKLLRSDGILALRISQSAFQFVGLSLALLLLRRLLRSWIAMIFAAGILTRWMFPTWKIYEPMILIAAIYFAVLVIEHPSRLRHFVAGIFIGFAAFFGRNHGVYCTVAFVLLIVFVFWKTDRRALFERLGLLAAGIVIGYLPMLLMMAFVSGFFDRVIEDLVFNLHNGTTLPIPVPWPWRQTYRLIGLREAINRLSISCLFLLFPAFYLFAFARLIFKRTVRAHPVFIASAFVGVIYLHYTFGRPQLYYLAWTIPPVIFGLLAVPLSCPTQHKKALTIVVWAILAVFSLGALELGQENYFSVKVRTFIKAKLLRRYGGDFDQAMSAQDLVETDVRGDNLWIAKESATLIDSAQTIDQKLLNRNDQILIVPYYPGLYTVLQKRSPLWEIYFLLPRPVSEQEKMVRDLESKRVKWALVCQHYVDERPELAFRNTHSFLWQYLVANFETLRLEETKKLEPNCELMRRKDLILRSAEGTR